MIYFPFPRLFNFPLQYLSSFKNCATSYVARLCFVCDRTSSLTKIKVKWDFLIPFILHSEDLVLQKFGSCCCCCCSSAPSKLKLKNVICFTHRRHKEFLLWKPSETWGRLRTLRNDIDRLSRTTRRPTRLLSRWTDEAVEENLYFEIKLLADIFDLVLSWLCFTFVCKCMLNFYYQSKINHF